MRAAVPRWLGFFVVWLVLSGAAPGALPYGVVATTLATWASMALVPAGAYRIRWGALLLYLPHFLWQSVVAGIDVAQRAFTPSLRLRPGFVTYPIRFRSASARNAFSAVTGLLPGTVPCADDHGGLVYHCLDIGQPVLDQLAAEETRLAAIIDEAGHA